MKMQAAYDAIMDMDAIIITKDDKTYELTIASGISCFAIFKKDKRIYFWDNLCGKELDNHGIDLNAVKEFYNRPEFTQEKYVWIKTIKKINRKRK